MEPKKPRFEVVVRVVRDNPEKTEEPKFRDVLYEIAVPLATEWNTQKPDLPPEQIMAMTALDMQCEMAAPMIEQIKKVPFDTMIAQCIQGLQAKKAAEAGSWVGVKRVPPEKKT
jgi:hypothetical protein